MANGAYWSKIRAVGIMGNSHSYNVQDCVGKVECEVVWVNDGY